MALTATQILQLKKHLAYSPLPDSTHLDLLLSPLQDGADIEAELVASIAECETDLGAIKTAQTAVDDLAEGGGAKFQPDRTVSAKKALYRRSVENLARIVNIAPPNKTQVGGFFSA